MNRALRTQADGAQDEYSDKASIDFADAIDTARQEFKDDADVNKLLAKFGVNAPQRQVTFGEVDYTLDLQDAFDAIKQAKAAYNRLPDEIKKDYPSWQTLLNGINTGLIHIKNEEPPAEPAAPTP